MNNSNNAFESQRYHMGPSIDAASECPSSKEIGTKTMHFKMHSYPLFPSRLGKFMLKFHSSSTHNEMGTILSICLHEGAFAYVPLTQTELDHGREWGRKNTKDHLGQGVSGTPISSTEKYSLTTQQYGSGNMILF